MMMDWFRSHHGAPTDPKWRTIAKRAGVLPGVVVSLAWALLDNASQAVERGSMAGADLETLADFMGYELDDVERVVAAMVEKGVLAGERFTAWERRQPKKEDDGAAERKRLQRERERLEREEAKRREGKQPDLPLVPPCHDTSRDVTIEQRRAEKSREEAGRPANAQAREPAASPPLSDDTEFKHACTEALGGRVKGSFAPMAALTGDRERIVELLRAESASRSKPIGWWPLAAEVAAERLAAAPPSARGSPAPPPPSVFVAVDTPEWDAWDRTGRANGHPRGYPRHTQEGGRHGWRFPSLWPTGAEPKTSPEPPQRAAE